MAKRRKKNNSGREMELLVAVLKFASLISRPMRDAVADPAGLSSNELRILIALSGEVESAGQDLAELMGMHAMNVSRALSSLHEMGLVEPVNNHGNRRRKPYRVSPRGAAACLALKPHIVRVADFLFGVLSTAERRSLETILAKLAAQTLAWQPGERHQHVARA